MGKYINVYEFNKRRNGFDLDEELEFDMLKEEIQEFFDAETVADMVDAFIDVDYVFNGTKQKYVRNMKVVPAELVEIHNDFVDVALDILSEVFKSDLAEVLDEATDIVCRINALKVSELDEDGKVVKQKDLPNATDEIADMLLNKYGVR